MKVICAVSERAIRNVVDDVELESLRILAEARSRISRQWRIKIPFVIPPRTSHAASTP